MNFRESTRGRLPFSFLWQSAAWSSFFLLFLLIGFSTVAAQRPKAPARKSPPQFPNVIVITLDTTRADRMGFLGSKRGLTPNLDAMAQQGVVFTRAYSHVPLTTASHTTIFTGTYPQFNHVNDFGVPLSPKLPYLPISFISMDTRRRRSSAL